MTTPSVVILGMPESGKSTFLAALWHLITDRAIDTKLKFSSLGSGNNAYLNALAKRWRDAKVQERTSTSGNTLVSINMIREDGSLFNAVFPDVPGESYRRMWEERECERDVASFLRSDRVLLFIHADTIRAPGWITDEIALTNAMGIKIEAGALVEWSPRLAPTQVQVLDLLQLLHGDSLNVGKRRLAIALSAWDKVAENERSSPELFLENHLPLLSQYLKNAAEQWDFRIYGLSAQGGDYDSTAANAVALPAAQKLRELQNPTSRIELIKQDGKASKDLTELLSWLTS